MLTRLLMGGHRYEELRDLRRLGELCPDDDEQLVEAVYYLLDNMVMD